MTNNKKINQFFKSCFIVDVAITDNDIVLSDSSHNKYYISRANTEVVKQFKLWFANIFCKGIAQTLTIFQYEPQDISECEVKINIVNFITKNNLAMSTI